jgi:hypothetical protein
MSEKGQRAGVPVHGVRFSGKALLPAAAVKFGGWSIGYPEFDSREKGDVFDSAMESTPKEGPGMI